MNMGINTEFIADSRLPQVFSGLNLNGTIFSLKMNFQHSGSHQGCFKLPGSYRFEAKYTIIFSH
jgi:hypothetical protein